MDFIELSVQSREEKGKSLSRKLRRLGFIPAVLYGGNSDATLLKVKNKDVDKLLHEGNRNAILKLKGLSKDTTAIIKEVQKEKVKDCIIHLDFQKVAMDTEIETAVAIELLGEAVGVTEGGVLQHNIRELHVKALPKDIPEKYEVDVSELAIGSSIKVSDLKALPGVEILDNPEDNIVSVVPPTELKEEEIAPPEEEVEEGAEVEREEGEEAPAEEGKEEAAKEGEAMPAGRQEQKGPEQKGKE